MTPNALDLERLFTTEQGFNVQAATPLQRSVCRAFRGVPVGELAEHPDVLDGWGGPDAVRALPVGAPPVEKHIVGPSRSGKSKLLAADALCASDGVDVALADVGDIVRVSVLGLKLATNAIWTHLCETIMARPLLRKLLIGDIGNGVFALRHRTGRPIEYMHVPVDRWGGSVISVYSAGVYIDEEPRQIGAEDGVKNWNGVHDASVGRLLPGAAFAGCGAPWAPHGPVYDLVSERFGKPGPDMVIVRGAGPQWNPSWWTPERCSDLERRNPDAYRSDVLAEFLDPETGLLSSVAVRRGERELPLELPPDQSGRYGAAVDVGVGRWTLVITKMEKVGQEADDLPYRFVVALAREFLGSDPRAAWQAIARECLRYGVTKAAVDQYAAAESVAIARPYGLTLEQRAWSGPTRLEAFTNLATLLHSGRVELPPDKLMRRDLLAVRKRSRQSGGYEIILPRTADGRHCDFAPALAASVRETHERGRFRYGRLGDGYYPALGGQF